MVQRDVLCITGDVLCTAARPHDCVHDCPDAFGQGLRFATTRLQDCMTKYKV